MKHTYHRGSIESTLNAAIKTVSGTNEVRYIFPTANGFIISKSPAPFGNPCYKIINGNVEKVGDWRPPDERYS